MVKSRAIGEFHANKKEERHMNKESEATAETGPTEAGREEERPTMMNRGRLISSLEGDSGASNAGVHIRPLLAPPAGGALQCAPQL